MGAHAEFLRVALDDDALPRAVIADPRALADRSPDPQIRFLVRLTQRVTETPWLLSAVDRAEGLAAGFDDAALLHAVVLSSYFGHLNRIADAVGIALDYDVAVPPRAPESATPPYLKSPRSTWPDPDAPRAINLALRPPTAEALKAWRSYVVDREGLLGRRRRQLIARAVGACLGDARAASEESAAASGDQDEKLVALAETVALAPWRLGASTVDALHALSLTGAAAFDALATATSCTTFSRIEVSLSALARPV